jgi:chromate transporter
MKELKEIIYLFLRLGCITFGGPAAHIAFFEHEVVAKRKWISQQHFLDLIGATNLIPGPNSTEIAMHTGYQHAGLAGLIAAGISFTLPAVLITGIFASIYAAYGTLPAVEPFLYGIKPAVLIIIIHAVYKLGSKAVKGWKLALIAVMVMAINLLGINEVIATLSGGILGGLFIYLSERSIASKSLFLFPLLTLCNLPPLFQTIERPPVSLVTLFLSCLKIGAVWFGGGYVLVAYFNGEFVQGLNWLTRRELLDAIAVGQFTPGPFLSSATFIGYQIAGIPGAIWATVGIMIPAFIFVALLNPIIPRLRKSAYFSKFLDAVNVSALAVMVVVSIKLGQEILIEWQSWIIALLSALSFMTIRKIKTVYIILGGAVTGYIFYLSGV